jgi:acyl carrier protein
MTQQEVSPLEKDVLAWITDWNEGQTPGVVEADTDLLGTGLLDSIGLVGLIAFVEERTGAELDNADFFDPDTAITVRSILMRYAEVE